MPLPRCQSYHYEMLNIYTNLKQDFNLEDGLARFESINPARSFIVQAPAGSGKTSLLTQRFLALLAVVEQPEQIVAMTYTKKAVSEMQLRILEALHDCVAMSEQQAAGKGLYQLNTWHLAQMALQNNAQRGWNLLENPHRLRIRTLDSFNSYLVGMMPLLSKLGGQTGVSLDASQYYILAARETLNTEHLSSQITNLMGLVNGNRQAAERMIAGMLAKRDQWMPLLRSMHSGIELPAFNLALQSLVETEFTDLMRRISPAVEKLLEISILIDQIVGLEEIDFFTPSLADLPNIRTLVETTFTQKGEVRKNATVKATTKAEKELKKQLKGCLEDLELKNFDGQLGQNLLQIINLPNTEYSAQQWQGVEDLWLLLMTSAAHLKLVFGQHNTSDFIEIAQAASDALGEEDEPTDLAQRLDYQIQHLLVDEFQDTSVSQFVLLKKLIAGWSLEDNHTLFIVGDPMQSIYRFREAEVGNFLEAWQGKIGQFPLQQQRLTINFRSNLGVVDWVNQTFKQIMPKQNKIEKGAVCYSPSSAFSTNMNQAVTTHWQLNQSNDASVIEFIEQLKAILKIKQPHETIGILAKTKSALVPIAKLLKVEKIAFRAIEIETLAERQEIQDLEALTRALLHLGDRPAWIALLRTPAIGLGLKDLATLFDDVLNGTKTRYQTVWSVLQNHHQQGFAELSIEGQARLNQAFGILENAISHIGLMSWQALVQETWLALDFAQALESASLLQNVDAYWQMLNRLEQEKDGEISMFSLSESLHKLFALPNASEQSKQIEMMSMHKSKGLEFDYVMLPSLNKRGRSDDKELVNWLHFQKNGVEQLVFAPMAQRGKNKAHPDDIRLVNFMKDFEKEKQAYEQGRLLYVACTRAKQQLHLFANVDYTEKQFADDKPILPQNNTLLSLLWQSEKKTFSLLAKQADFVVEGVKEQSVESLVTRLPIDRECFITIKAKIEKPQQKELAEIVPHEINPQKITQQHSQETMVTAVGNLVHLLFELWSNQQIMPVVLNDELKHMVRYWLQQQSVARELLDEAEKRTLVSLENAIRNKKIRWALTTSFKESANELPISSTGLVFEDKERAETINHIIDRTFVDENNHRWIVDYKTSYHTAEMSINETDFLKMQVNKYHTQLKRYADLFKQLEEKPQHLVLYFSYIDKWLEIDI